MLTSNLMKFFVFVATITELLSSIDRITVKRYQLWANNPRPWTIKSGLWARRRHRLIKNHVRVKFANSFMTARGLRVVQWKAIRRIKSDCMLEIGRKRAKIKAKWLHQRRLIANEMLFGWIRCQTARGELMAPLSIDGASHEDTFAQQTGYIVKPTEPT